MKMLQTKGYFYCSIILLCCATTLVACHGQSSDSNNQMDDDIMCLCPPTVYLQPYGNFTQKEASILGNELESHLSEMFNVDLDCEVLPELPLVDSLLNKSKIRYRADKIIKSLSSKADGHNIYIGLTHKDISCSVHGKEDWGVQGLSLIPGKACVVSTFCVKKH